MTDEEVRNPTFMRGDDDEMDNFGEQVRVSFTWMEEKTGYIPI